MNERISLRDAFGEALLEEGKINKKIYVLSADLEDSTRAEKFKFEFPERFLNLGIAEQDIIGTGVGLALEGFIPVVTSFAAFLTTRPYDMIRILGCYNNTNLKIVASHAGLTVESDGGTAQMLEDIAIMRVLPNMKVISPVDAYETKKALKYILNNEGIFYLRLSRTSFPLLTKKDDEFKFGKASIMKQGKDVTIIASGIMVSRAIIAAEVLKTEGIDISVINLHTIKPLDIDTILKEVKKTGALVTAEEHQKIGGIGSAIAELLAQNYPVPIEMIAVDDSFGESGKTDELFEKYGLSETHIISAVKKVIKRKRR